MNQYKLRSMGINHIPKIVGSKSFYLLSRIQSLTTKALISEVSASGSVLRQTPATTLTVTTSKHHSQTLTVNSRFSRQMLLYLFSVPRTEFRVTLYQGIILPLPVKI